MKRNVMFKILLMIVVGVFLSLDAFAQQMTVKGIVKDTTGEPIIGANVVVKGSSNGTITDFEGNFQFNANKGCQPEHYSERRYTVIAGRCSHWLWYR